MVWVVYTRYKLAPSLPLMKLQVRQLKMLYRKTIIFSKDRLLSYNDTKEYSNMTEPNHIFLNT